MLCRLPEALRNEPPKIIEERPECVAEFLAWLLPKQSQLAQLVAADLATRSVSAQSAVVARATLSSREECLRRHVDFVLLKKGLFLLYNCKAHPHIAATSTFQALIDKAASIILSTAIDDSFLELMQVAAHSKV